MDRYTVSQRVEIVKTHYQNGESFAETFRKVRASFGHQHAPSRTTIVKIIKKFERLGQVNDVKTSTRVRLGRSAENIAAVTESLFVNPGLSISRRSRELGLSYGSVWRIIHQDLQIPLSDTLSSMRTHEPSDAEDADSQELIDAQLLAYQQEIAADFKGEPVNVEQESNMDVDSEKVSKDSKCQFRKSEEDDHRIMFRIFKPRHRNLYRKVIRDDQEQDTEQWLPNEKRICID